MTPGRRHEPPAGPVRTLWRRLDSSLQARILLPTIVLFALTLCAMAWGAVKLYTADMRRAQLQRAEYFTEMVEHGVKAAMLDGGAAQLPGLLAALKGHRGDVVSASVVDPDGVVVASTDEALLGTRRGARPAAGGPRLVDRPDEGEFVMLRPVEHEQSCLRCHEARPGARGWLDIRFSLEPVVAAQRRLARTLALSVAPAFLLLVGIAWWLVGREAVGPLQRLVDAASRAAAGDLEVRADEGRPDELGRAARSVDTTVATLRRSTAELEAFYAERMVRADRFAALGELASGLAHEIKNPLAGLSGALEVLAEDLQTPVQREVVGEMRHQVARLARTMEALLGYARPPRPRLQPVDLSAVLEKVLFLVRQQRLGGPLQLVCECAPHLPPVLGDPAQLEQVFLNLCLNSVQALDGGGGRLAVRLRADDGRATVEVEDDGPGIPPEARPHVFQPFYTTRRGGTGLGLAICARIVSDHGGHIGYRCPEQGGTVFTVSLGLARPAAEQAAC